MTSMALKNMRATTISLDPEQDSLLTVAAEAEGVSRSEFVRRSLRFLLEQYRDHPLPRSAGIIEEALPERGDEGELFGSGG